jgi:hypothetical protein
MQGGEAMTTEQDFWLKRFAERLTELRQRYPDDKVFYVEATKLQLTMARNDKERKEAKEFMKIFKLLAK